MLSTLKKDIFVQSPLKTKLDCYSRVFHLTIDFRIVMLLSVVNRRKGRSSKHKTMFHDAGCKVKISLKCLILTFDRISVLFNLIKIIMHNVCSIELAGNTLVTLVVSFT